MASKSSGSSPPPSQTPVVELSRYRAQLSRGKRVRRAEALFQTSDPRGAVRALPGDEFFYVLSELGFPEAHDVLVLGTPEQVQTALDFALWDRDQLSPTRVEEWLGALVEAPVDVVGRWAKGLDVELLALLLRKRATIYDLTQEESPPEDSDQPTFRTPDSFFIVELQGEEDEVRTTTQLLDAIYRYDPTWARRILIGARSELDAELEETAFRWRSGRMADLGFEDHYDALEVYREIDPALAQPQDTPAPRVKAAGESGTSSHYLQVPSALAERLGGSAPFARAVAGVSDSEELANIHASLVLLSNRVLSADRITPGDETAMTATLERVSATLDLAVEVLARGRPEEATRAVRTVPLLRLFQLGGTLIGKVKKLAIALERQTPFAKLSPPLSLLEDEDARIVASLTKLRPMFPLALERPPADGERPFGKLADIALATAALERAGAGLALLQALGLKPDQLTPPASDALPVDDLTFLDAGLLGRTLFARALISGTPSLRPLSDEEVKSLDALAGPNKRDAVHKRLLPLVQAAWSDGGLSATAAAIAERWVDELLSGAPLLTSDGRLRAAR